MTRTVSWSLHFLGINHIQAEQCQTMGKSANFDTSLPRALSWSCERWNSYKDLPTLRRFRWRERIYPYTVLIAWNSWCTLIGWVTQSRAIGSWRRKALRSWGGQGGLPGEGDIWALLEEESTAQCLGGKRKQGDGWSSNRTSWGHSGKEKKKPTAAWLECQKGKCYKLRSKAGQGLGREDVKTPGRVAFCLYVCFLKTKF